MTADPFTIPTAAAAATDWPSVSEFCTRLLAADDAVGADPENDALSNVLLNFATELEDRAMKYDDDDRPDDIANLVISILLGYRPDLVDAARNAQ